VSQRIARSNLLDTGHGASNNLIEPTPAARGVAPLNILKPQRVIRWSQPLVAGFEF
jgi:hypothetical protein